MSLKIFNMDKLNLRGFQGSSSKFYIQLRGIFYVLKT